MRDYRSLTDDLERRGDNKVYGGNKTNENACACLYKRKCACVCIYVCMYESICGYVPETPLCVYACVNAYVNVCRCVCMCALLYCVDVQIMVRGKCYGLWYVVDGVGSEMCLVLVWSGAV